MKSSCVSSIFLACIFFFPRPPLFRHVRCGHAAPIRSHGPAGSHAERTDCGSVPGGCCERGALWKQLADPVHAVHRSQQLSSALPDRLLHVQWHQRRRLQVGPCHLHVIRSSSATCVLHTLTPRIDCQTSSNILNTEMVGTWIDLESQNALAVRAALLCHRAASIACSFLHNRTTGQCTFSRLASSWSPRGRSPSPTSAMPARATATGPPTSGAR